MQVDAGLFTPIFPISGLIKSRNTFNSGRHITIAHSTGRRYIPDIRVVDSRMLSMMIMGYTPDIHGNRGIGSSDAAGIT